MKTLAPADLVELCDALPAEEQHAAQMMGRKFDCEADWLLNKDFYQSQTVRVNGERAFLVFYHVNDQRRLFVNSATQLTAKKIGVASLVQGCRALAQKLGCAGIETMTLRAGLLKELLAAGFKPIGVSVEYAL